jgi:membrane fusion protein (multidrug efflux system)
MTSSIQRLVPGSPTVRRIVLPIGVLLLGLLLLTVFTRSRSAGGESAQGAAGGAAGAGPASMPPMPVDVDTARLSPVTDVVRATGRIEANQSVELRPDETGRVVQIHFREGQLVRAGAPLVKIDDAMLRAQRERALADRDLSRQQLARVRRLREENAATPADLERAEATARSAEAAVNVIELQLRRTTVRAPFAGVIGQRFVSIGDYVTSASRLLSLQTVDPQRAVLEIPERHAGLLRPGQSVEFSVAAYPEQTFTAQVEFVDPVVQPSTRTILVKARAPNRDRKLSSGMFIEARLATSTRASAVVVPEDAVQPLRTANVVWAVVNGQASRRVVELGARSQGTVEVLSGVNPGELVVVGGLERIGEGMPVDPRPRSVAGG